MVNWTGTSGNDIYTGTTGADSLDGGAGDDIIRGNGTSGSADFLYGGIGNDTLYGGVGVDWLSGDAGNDTLYSSSGNDNLNGGAGNDTFIVSGLTNGFDSYTGGPTGTTDTDIIKSDTGYDTVIGISSITRITAIQGNTLHTTRIVGADTGSSLDFTGVLLTNITSIEGGSGVDTITGSSKSDVVNLNNGDDFYSTDKSAATATGVIDTVDGGAGADVALFGYGGSGDTLTANANGTWTAYDPTLSITWSISHTATTAWTVTSSTGSTTYLSNFETLSFGNQTLTSSSGITPHGIRVATMSDQDVVATLFNTSDSDFVTMAFLPSNFSDAAVTTPIDIVGSDVLTENGFDAFGWDVVPSAGDMDPASIVAVPDVVGDGFQESYGGVPAMNLGFQEVLSSGGREHGLL